MNALVILLYAFLIVICVPYVNVMTIVLTLTAEMLVGRIGRRL